MKLQNKKKKIITTIVVVAVAVLLILGIAIAIIASTLSNSAYAGLINSFLGGIVNNGKTQKIIISSYPNTEYFVGEEFDYEGLIVQVINGTNSSSNFINGTDKRLTVTGFDSSVANEALTITVSFEGFTESFEVTIKDPPPPPAEKKLVSIKISENFQTTYTKDWWNFFGPNFDGAKLILTFSDNSTQEVEYIYKYCTYDNVSAAGEYSLEFTYKYDGTNYTCTVPITITN